MLIIRYDHNYKLRIELNYSPMIIIIINSAHQQHMREMDRMMGGFGPLGGFGFGSPFASPFGMLEGPRERGEGRRPEERGMVPRDRPRDPFESMFGNMHSMMSQMHRNFVSVKGPPTSSKLSPQYYGVTVVLYYIL